MNAGLLVLPRALVARSGGRRVSESSYEVGGALAARSSSTVASFEAVYAEWFSEVARWARAMGGPRADLEDICQDVFLTVRRKLVDFDGQNLGGWLYRITQRTVIAHRRKAWVRRALFLDGDEWQRVEGSSTSALSNVERREETALLEELLGKLSLPKRTALVLHEVEGRTAEEIAELEGVPVPTIYSRLHYAKREMAAMLVRRGKGRG